jgi:hypothetical protein
VSTSAMSMPSIDVPLIRPMAREHPLAGDEARSQTAARVLSFALDLLMQRHLCIGPNAGHPVSGLGPTRKKPRSVPIVVA